MKGKKLTTEEFIKRAYEVHGKKYDYSNVEYFNSHKKIKIICPIHGEFEQIPYGHLLGYSCKKCSNILVSNKKSFSKKRFIEQAIEIHEEKYDYSLVDYKNNKTKVTIICPIHGKFEQTPSSHISSEAGCKLCGYKKISSTKTKTKKDFLEQAKIVHGEKYDYSNVDYTGTDDYISILCKKHGEFFQKPTKHLQKQGCPICCESKLELMIRKNLIENEIQFIQQYSKKNGGNWLNGQSIDFYLPETRIAIECQGEQHFKPVDFGNKGIEWSNVQFKKTILRDKIKYVNCLKNNVKILYFANTPDLIGDSYLDTIYFNVDDLIKQIKNEKRLL